MDILKYKDYEGTAELDMDRGVCYGKILFIEDLVTYEAANPKELIIEFEAAVDDYLATCVELGREPKKPLKGIFQVRIQSDLHKGLVLRALNDNISQNELVGKAIEAYLCAHQTVNHNVHMIVDVEESEIRTFAASSGQAPQLGTLRVYN